MDKKLHLVSLGCTKNLVDSEVMLGKLSSYDITQNADEADVIIVNTCGFIDAAKEESIQKILELHKIRKEDSLLVMSGCLSQRYKDELTKELKEVDIFTGVGDYDKIDELIEKKQNLFSQKTYLIKNQDRIITGSNFHAYIKLSEGCNQQCSFCAIPHFKGKLQSRRVEDIKNEVTQVAKKGFYDFSFISQDSSSYLRDFNQKDGLIKLIKSIEEIKEVKSARILYLYPSTLSYEVLKKIIESKKFHNYFDMPIQHISDRLLKIMKRGNDSKLIKKQLDIMRDAKDSFLRTSIIVGHPGERDEDFDELCEFLNDFDFDRINIFAYSDEEGTKAHTMDQKVPEVIIAERIDILNKIVQKKMRISLEKELNRQIEIVITGSSSEHELFLGAKKLQWAQEIDGEILINENLTNEKLIVGKRYKAKVTQIAGEKLIATVTQVA